MKIRIWFCCFFFLIKIGDEFGWGVVIVYKKFRFGLLFSIVFSLDWIRFWLPSFESDICVLNPTQRRIWSFLKLIISSFFNSKLKAKRYTVSYLLFPFLFFHSSVKVVLIMTQLCKLHIYLLFIISDYLNTCRSLSFRFQRMLFLRL